MKLFLVRHGETPWTREGCYQGRTDTELTPLGHRQAETVARFFQKEKISFLYASPLKRVWHTAQAVARHTRLKIIPDKRLMELDFGKWEGISFKKLLNEKDSSYKKWLAGKISRPPGGESIAALARRVGSFFKEVRKRHARETGVVVSHGGPIRMLLLQALQKGKVIPAPFLSIWSFRIEPASISLFEGTEDFFQINFTNQRAHLR